MSEAAAAPLPRSAGALLAAERERQGLSRADISQRLHLSVSQIEALEAGDVSRLAGGPFLKGFVRNYARALGIDPDPLVSLVLRDAPAVPPPSLAVPNQGIRFDPFGRRLSAAALRAAIAAVVVLVAGVGVLYWWLNVYPAVPKPASAPADTRTAELPGVAPPLPPEPVAAPAPAAAASTSVEPARPGAAVAPPPPQLPAGLARVRLLSAERTWVEIVDGAGERVTSRHIEAGTPAEFLGRPPLRVAVGNAPGTRLSYNGREIDLAPHTRAAVARLTLE